MERDKIKAEYEDLMKLIASLQELLGSETLRFELIVKELEEDKRQNLVTKGKQKLLTLMMK